MKNYIFICMIATFVGCTKQATVTPCAVPVVPITNGEVVTHVTEDGFDKAGQATAIGARWTYNQMKNAYEWVTSPENKERANRAWQTTKKVTVKAADVVADTAHKVIDENK